jgi:hypothetical protein
MASSTGVVRKNASGISPTILVDVTAENRFGRVGCEGAFPLGQSTLKGLVDALDRF